MQKTSAHLVVNKQYKVGLPYRFETNRGNKYLLIAMDYFSKWSEVFAISNQEASTFDVLIENVFSRFGVPLELHSDQRRNFEFKLFHRLCDLLDIRKTPEQHHYILSWKGSIRL